jgi:nucleotide-binding universal stress UspA family protein
MVSTRIKRILVPTDFSDCSQAGVEYAISLAKDFEAQIYLLHVMEPPVYGIDFSLMDPGVLPSMKNQLVKMVQKLVDRLREEGIEAVGDFVTGVPSTEIVKAAKKQVADLIIMGTHGRTGFAHVMLGSTAERVLQQAHCPVLTVKAIKRVAQAGEEAKAGTAGASPAAGGAVSDKDTTFCHLCGKPSQDIACEACKIRVQAEAFDRKQKVEKVGRVGTGRR